MPMTIRLLLPALVMLGLVILGLAVPAHAGLSLGSVPKTCLPTADRMSINRDDPCHCPPEEMCDTVDMPPFIRAVCCEQGDCKLPQRCDFGFYKAMSTNCPGCAPGSGHWDWSLCLEAVADNEDDEDAVDAVNAYNNCMASCDVTSVTFPFTGEGRGVSSDNNAAIGFFACAQSCRADLASAAERTLSSDNAAARYLQFANDYLTLDVHDVIGDDNDNCSGFDTQVDHCTSGDGDLTGGDQGQELLEAANNLDLSETFNADFSGFASCNISDDLTFCATAVSNDGTCGSCLDAQTPVLLGDGTSRVISEIKAGDVVKTHDGTATVAEVVIKDWDSLTLYSINGGALQLTADHPVMTKHGWRAVDYNTAQDVSVKRYNLHHVPVLKVGDMLLTSDGELEVTSIEAMETRIGAQTYNLRLDGGDTFYAGGILVKDN